MLLDVNMGSHGERNVSWTFAEEVHLTVKVADVGLDEESLIT
jgi:hypothetical protein